VSRELFIGVSSMTANAPGDVVIQQVSDPRFLGAEDNSVNLWAVVDNFDRVSTAWCEVKPPDYMLPDPGDAGGSEQAEMDIVRTFYSENSENLFQWTNLGEHPDDPDFSDPGIYQVFFFAKDFYSGTVSPLMETRVYKAESDNLLPDPFSLVSPLDATENEKTVSTTPILDWEDTSDPDGDSLSYTVVLSRDDPFFRDPFYKEGLTHSVCLLPPSDGLADGGVYYWKVWAIDEYGAVRESEVRVFRTDNYNNPLDGWIQGHVYDADTCEPVDIFDLVVGDETIRTASEGYYIGEKSPGKYDVRIEADGYESDRAEVEIIEEEVVAKDFRLKEKRVADPTFSPSSGIYAEGQNVEISCATSGVTIRYTTGGNEPDESSDEYISPVSVAGDMTIKAKAYDDLLKASRTITAEYKISTDGDVNADKKTDLADVILILRLLTGRETASTVNMEAETGGDEKIGLADVIYIMKALAELEDFTEMDHGCDIR